MYVSNQNWDYPRWKPKNHWHSVDAWFQNWAVTVVLSLVPLKMAICWWCLTATKSLIHYHTYKTKNCWYSSDAHSQNGAVTLLLSLLPIKVANTSVMPNSYQVTIQVPYWEDQQSWTLHWHSFSEWGSGPVAVSFGYKSYQYIGYASQRPSHYWIIILKRPRIVYAPLMRILRMRQRPCRCLFYLQRQPIHWLCLTATKSIFNYHT